MPTESLIQKAAALVDHDLQVQQDVEDELDWEPSVDAARVTVDVDEGVVTLRGVVPSYAEKHAATEAAQRVRGVRALADELDVRLREAHVQDDATLAAAVADALEWDLLVPEATVHARVDEGVVTLSGTVPWYYQRQRAVEAVGRLLGVRRVVNLLRIAPPKRPGAREVQAQIERALARSARDDADGLRVEVDGGVVTLSGTVRSLVGRGAAVRAASAAPGVTEVHDRLTVRAPSR